MTANWDGINKNFYLYYNSSIQRFQFIPWDLDLTIAGDVSINFPVYENGLFEKLYAEPAYRARIESCISNVFDYDELSAMVDNLEARLNTSFSRSPHAIIKELTLDEELSGVRQYLISLAAGISNL